MAKVNVSCVVVRPKVRSQVVQVLALEVASAANGTNLVLLLRRRTESTIMTPVNPESEWRYLGSYGDLHTKLSSFDQERVCEQRKHS